MNDAMNLNWDTLIDSINTAAIAGELENFTQINESKKVSCSGIISDIVLSDIHSSAIIDIGNYERHDSSNNCLICDNVVASIRSKDNIKWFNYKVGDRIHITGTFRSNVMNKYIEIQPLSNNRYYLSILISDAIPGTVNETERIK